MTEPTLEEIRQSFWKDGYFKGVRNGKLEEKGRIKKELLERIDGALIVLRKRKEGYDEEEQRNWVGTYNELCGRIDGLELARAEIEKL